MTRCKVKKNIAACVLGFATATMLLSNYAATQEKGIVLAEFKPTLSGHKNIAFIETDKVGPERKEMLVFWKKDEPTYTLVAALGGRFWGKGAGVKIGSNGE